MVACILMDRGPSQRWDAFVTGLKVCGYQVVDRPRHKPEDVLVVWNRSPTRDREARTLEENGGRVIVAENGYIGRDQGGWPHYALASGQHNGAGLWVVGDEDRWTPLNVKLKPWRQTGDHILLLPQRSIGSPGVAMPKNWLAEVRRRLATRRPIKVRPHPGTNRVPLDPDLRDCWAAVTWGSGAAIKALVAGVPVFHEFEQWIGAPAARFGLDIENPFLGDRLPMLRRVAWAQWSLPEIATGTPFRQLLNLRN